MAIRSKSLLQKIVIPLICLALSLSLLTFNIVQPRVNLLEIAISYLFYPFQKTVHSLNLLGTNVKGYCQLLGTTRRENHTLKEQLETMQQELARLKETEAAQQRLQALLDFQLSNPALEITSASVIAMAPSNWVNVIIIDKGEAEGIKENMPVVVPQGIVGQVIKVGRHFAKVLLIIDQRSGVGALDQRTRAVGVLEGQLSKIALLKYLDPTAEVTLEDMVVSSGMGGVFPKGLVLGKVTNIEREKTGVYQRVEVTLSVDFSRLEEVLVIKSAALEEAVALEKEEEEK